MSESIEVLAEDALKVMSRAVDCLEDGFYPAAAEDLANATQTVRQLAEQREALLEALRKAEAALADIGDADREPGDDLAWCERRAGQDLPIIRAAIALAQGDAA